MINFRQINLRKSEQATVLLGQALENQTHSIALISEPHTVMNKITGYPKGTKIIYNRTNPQGHPPRAGIVFSNDLKVTALDSIGNRDFPVKTS